MKDLTDEEYDALDEYYTKNPPDVDFSKNGGYAMRPFKSVTIDRFTADWIMDRAIESGRGTSEVLRELVEKEIAASQ